MDFLSAAGWAEALRAKAATPEALPICGGTDVMVELNLDRRRPAALLDLTAVAELATWETAGGRVRLGAGVTFARLIDEFGDRLPALAMSARTVGSPEIRNRGTIGGNLGTASPAGDAHPPLLACGAEIEVASAARGVRRIPATAFYTGPGRNALAADELIRAIRIPDADGPQHFAKVGVRGAMAIAVCAFAIALRPSEHRVGTGIGAAAPTPLSAADAEDLLAAELDWSGAGDLPEGLAVEFGALVAAAARPIDDVRGTASYRRRALAVLARRTLTWAWNDYQEDVRRCA
jgi:CO/xanthine dehydrogenase FAD-binding subunit